MSYDEIIADLYLLHLLHFDWIIKLKTEYWIRVIESDWSTVTPLYSEKVVNSAVTSNHVRSQQ